ncbi:MAG: hypothetical protein JO326_13770, partial [Acetobacteraceae bacterium]|nr:hypothetical protein [Acetobacteraceae bacterium]
MPGLPFFSLPVHEKPDIVADQVANLRRFCPNAVICLHVSPSYRGDLAPFQALATDPAVLLNPRRLATVHGRGLLHVHVANFAYAYTAHPEISKVCLISSNELLIRDGVADYLNAHDAGAQFCMWDPLSDWRVFRRRVDLLPAVAAMLKSLGAPVIFGGQAEGQFYDAALFLEIVSVFARFFPWAPAGFETEEVVPQTVAVRLLGPQCRVGLPFTLQNYCNRFELTPELVSVIRGGHAW